VEKKVQIEIKGEIKELKGKEAEIAIEAIKRVLKHKEVEAEENEEEEIGINYYRYRRDLLDGKLPKDFSYAEALFEALNLKLQDPQQIADYILQKRKSCF